MLSSIHPLGEAGRGQRWWLTVTAHIAGAALGGAIVASALGTAGWAVARLGVGWTARLAVVAAVAAVAVWADGRRWPAWLWRPHRQVNEDWLTAYRGWVYGGGFGVQLGMGAVTIVTAATLYVLAAVAFALATAVPALVLGAVFGATRGATVLAGGRIDRAERLVRFHRRLHERARWGRLVAVGADVSVLAGVAVLLWNGA
jgi:hypothetical protein